MKKKMTSVVLAMAMAACVCSTIRVEAASPSEVLAPISQTELWNSMMQYSETSEVYVRKADSKEMTAKLVVTRYGMTIEKIATRLSLTEEYLLSANEGFKFEVDEEIPLYEEIMLPEIYWGDVENVYYVVLEGDNLSEISEYFHTSIADIQKLNPQITNSNLIYAESFIRIK